MFTDLLTKSTHTQNILHLQISKYSYKNSQYITVTNVINTHAQAVHPGLLQ